MKWKYVHYNLYKTQSQEKYHDDWWELELVAELQLDFFLRDPPIWFCVEPSITGMSHSFTSFSHSLPVSATLKQLVHTFLSTKGHNDFLRSQYESLCVSYFPLVSILFPSVKCSIRHYITCLAGWGPLRTHGFNYLLWGSAETTWIYKQVHWFAQEGGNVNTN